MKCETSLFMNIFREDFEKKEEPNICLMHGNKVHVIIEFIRKFKICSFNGHLFYIFFKRTYYCQALPKVR